MLKESQEQYKNMSLDELAELDIQELAENFDIATLIELRIEAAKQEAPYWESKGIDFDVENESFVGMPQEFSKKQFGRIMSMVLKILVSLLKPFRNSSEILWFSQAVL